MEELFGVILMPLMATIVIELGVLRFLGERSRKVLWSSVVVNVLTNVPLNLWAYSLPSIGWTDMLVGEAVVIVVETLWYYWFVRSLRQSLVYAFLCNAISFLTGLLAVLVIAYFWR